MDFFARYKSLCVELEKTKLEDLPLNKVTSYIASIEVAQPWLHRTIRERAKANVDTKEYKCVLNKLTEFRSKLVRLEREKTPKQKIRELLDICARVYDLFVLYVNKEPCEIDKAMNFKSKVLGKCNLLDFNKDSDRSYTTWLNSLQSCFTRLYNLSGTLRKRQLGKTVTATFSLLIDPDYLVRKRLGA